VPTVDALSNLPPAIQLAISSASSSSGFDDSFIRALAGRIGFDCPRQFNSFRNYGLTIMKEPYPTNCLVYNPMVACPPPAIYYSTYRALKEFATPFANKLRKEMAFLAAASLYAANQMCFPGRFSAEDLNDSEFMQYVVQFDADVLKLTSVAVRDNMEVVTAAVTKKGSVFQYASEGLRNNKQLVMRAIQQQTILSVSEGGHALQHASLRLRSDKKVVLRAVQTCGLALEFASEELQDDIEVVRAAIQPLHEWLKGHPLRFASERLRDNIDVVSEAMLHDPAAWRFASRRLRGDKNFVLRALAVKHSTANSLKDVSRDLRDDEDVVWMAYSKHGEPALEHASERLRSNREWLSLRQQPLRYDPEVSSRSGCIIL